MKTNKLPFLLAIVLIFTLSAHGQYVTPGNNSSLTLTDLVNMSSGVVTGGNGHFLINNNLTIAATDTLKIITDDSVLVSATMLIEVQGVLICNPPNLAVFRAQDTAAPFKGFKFSDSHSSLLQNASIEFAGGNKVIGSNMTINNCRFYKNAYSQASAAVDIFQCNPIISNCVFDQNQRSAVATAANAVSSPKILNSYFYKNNTTNSNRPQINLGSGSTDTVVIRGNTIIGEYDKAGGISASTLVGGQLIIIVDSNSIVNNRYGINMQGAGVNYTITNNNIIDNNLETNPNLGGSGISFSTSNTGMVSNNLITGNLWGITILNSAQPNLGQIEPTVVNVGKNHIYNNGNNGQTYNLYNNTPGPITAQNNYWGTNNADSAELGIFHYPDDNTLGLVNYLPIYQISNENQMLSFELTDNSVSATGTIEGQTITVHFETTVDIENLTAIFTVSDRATVFVNDELQISGVSTQNFSDTVIYTVVAENLETRDYAVIVTAYEPSNENQLLTFSLTDGNQTAVGVITDNVVNVEFNSETDLSQLIATFTLSDSATAWVNGELQVSGVSVQDFSDTVIYTIMAENLETRDYTVIVTAYEPSGENQLLTFSLTDGNQTAEGEITDNVVEVAFYPEIDLSQLTATFTLSDKATAWVNGVEQVSGETVNNFENWVTYVIRAENGETNEYIVKVDIIIGISNAKVDVKIMPNPANESVMIKSDCKILSINLFEIDGKLIKSWKADSDSKLIEVGDIGGGVYILKVETTQETIIQKLIVH
ncbi:MAG TPA: T9SS type A sorting domain-containing protein [Salinivirgaceae bacterium]|nr:T9SS type A sorting domain-containing protein [Salinivirgaceae bacterium]HQA75694.1 T9SS type A sorting domain-containing protein [Salinivirgaceae bacterium]